MADKKTYNIDAAERYYGKAAKSATPTTYAEWIIHCATLIETRADSFEDIQAVKKEADKKGGATWVGFERDNYVVHPKLGTRKFYLTAEDEEKKMKGIAVGEPVNVSPALTDLAAKLRKGNYDTQAKKVWDSIQANKAKAKEAKASA